MATVAFAALVAAGCSSDAPTSTGAGIDADGQANLSVVFNDLSAISTATASATGDADTDPILPGACPYSATSRSFICPERVRRVGDDVFHLESSFMLLDVGGASQSGFDLATTSGVRVLLASHDTLTLPPSGSFPGGTYTVARTSDHTVSGLLTDTRTLSGVGASTSSLLGFAEYDTTSAVVLPPPGSTNVLPTSGTIVIGGPSSAGGARSPTTVTFVGGNSFTISSTSGAARTCTMDAVTRDVSCS
jgi:hypothetical protein